MTVFQTVKHFFENDIQISVAKAILATSKTSRSFLFVWLDHFDDDV